MTGYPNDDDPDKGIGSLIGVMGIGSTIMIMPYN
jgi:hypothetical protein